MLRQLSALVVTVFLMATVAQAKNEAPAAPDCEKQASEKKLAGAAKTSFMKKCSGGDASAPAASAAPAAPATAAAPAAPATAAAPAADCEKQAAEKKLAGAAKTSFMKKCSGGDAAAAPAAKLTPEQACDNQVAEKKLAGAAKTSFVKKCIADAK